MRRIQVYDTTLRDGSQGEGISFSLQDKLLVTERLANLGFDFVEGGYPGSNPKDLEFFQAAQALRLKQAKLAAFGATRRKGVSCERDPGMQGLRKAGTPVATIFGKSWELHVTDALRIPLEENLDIIHDSIRWLTKHFDEFPGVGLLRAVAAEIRLPAFAIGGINPENLPEVLATGFTRIAVAGAVTTAADPGTAARQLLPTLTWTDQQP